MRKELECGYAGLIGILVTVAIIALAFAYIVLAPEDVDPELKDIQPMTASGTIPTTERSRLQADLDKANAVADKVNAKNRTTEAQMNE